MNCDDRLTYLSMYFRSDFVNTFVISSLIESSRLKFIA